MENVLLKKLHLKAGHTLLLDQAPEHILSVFGDFPSSVTLVFDEGEAFDGLLLFAQMADDLYQRLTALQKYFKPETLIWIAYPKKNTGIETDLSMMGPWQKMESLNLRPCASVAINEVWTGIRLKPIDQVKSSGVANESIKNNSYSEFIDIDNKIITIPPILKIALKEHPLEYAFLESLSWTNKKEYVLWILTAKQEKTRADRLSKMITFLTQRKKNPTAK